MKMLACAAVALMVAAPASAARVPFWYWTPAQANANVVRANPQHIDTKGDPTTALSAKCAGTGASKLRARARVFARFNCQVAYRDDKYGITTSPTDLYVTTSKAKRNALGCWSRFGAAGVAKECRP